MHKRRKKRKIFFLLVIVFLLLGFYLYKNNNIEENNFIKEKMTNNKIITKGIFKNYYNDASKIVEKMTIEEKVGQLFLVRYNKNDIEYLSNFYPGGYILFAKDFQNHTKESLRKEIEHDQELNKYKLIIGVDEEGGFVTRVSRFPAFRSEKFASPRDYYNQGGYELLEKMENEKAKLLKDIGINLNLAPVADVSTNESDFINNRTFGRDAKETSNYIKQMVKYANNNKINSCLKHFPGYGNNEDTHTGVAIDNRDYESFKENDYLPFIAGIEENVPCILVSHNIMMSVDNTYPSTLSEKVIKELRDTLGFTGIIITDDLSMDAVKQYVEGGNAATLAINAGNDMLITSDFISMKNELIKAVEDGNVKEETIDKAVTRIIAWKYYSGILEKR